MGQCHCNIGYAPPNCIAPGNGGSYHSNPITAAKDTSLYTSLELTSAVSAVSSLVAVGGASGLPVTTLAAIGGSIGGLVVIAIGGALIVRRCRSPAPPVVGSSETSAPVSLVGMQQPREYRLQLHRSWSSPHKRHHGQMDFNNYNPTFYGV